MTAAILSGLAFGLWAQLSVYFVVKVLNARDRNLVSVLIMAVCAAVTITSRPFLSEWLGPFGLGLAAALGFIAAVVVGGVVVIGGALRTLLVLFAVSAPAIALTAAVAGVVPACRSGSTSCSWWAWRSRGSAPTSYSRHPAANSSLCTGRWRAHVAPSGRGPGKRKDQVSEMKHVLVTGGNFLNQGAYLMLVAAGRAIREVLGAQPVISLRFGSERDKRWIGYETLLAEERFGMFPRLGTSDWSRAWRERLPS